MHLVFRHQKQVRQVFSTWSSSDQCNLKNQTVCNGNQLSFFKSVWLATKVYYLFYLAVVHISLTLFSGTVFLASLFQFSISLLFHSLTLFQPALVGRQQLSGNCTEYCLFAFFFNFFSGQPKTSKNNSSSQCLPPCLPETTNFLSSCLDNINGQAAAAAAAPSCRPLRSFFCFLLFFFSLLQPSFFILSFL